MPQYFYLNFFKIGINMQLGILKAQLRGMLLRLVNAVFLKEHQ